MSRVNLVLRILLLQFTHFSISLNTPMICGSPSSITRMLLANTFCRIFILYRVKSTFSTTPLLLQIIVIIALEFLPTEFETLRISFISALLIILMIPSTDLPVGTSLIRISFLSISTLALIFNLPLPVIMILASSVSFLTRIPPVGKSGTIISSISNCPFLIKVQVKSMTSAKLNDGILEPAATAIPSLPFTNTTGYLAGRTFGSTPSPSSAGI